MANFAVGFENFTEYIMKKKIQFSLVYRDMWQSSGKFQPRKDQLAKIAPVIIEMGCFSRVETNGGAFEQVNLLAGENPNDAVRAFCKLFVCTLCLTMFVPSCIR